MKIIFRDGGKLDCCYIFCSYQGCVADDIYKIPYEEIDEIVDGD